MKTKPERGPVNWKNEVIVAAIIGAFATIISAFLLKPDRPESLEPIPEVKRLVNESFALTLTDARPNPSSQKAEMRNQFSIDFYLSHSNVILANLSGVIHARPETGMESILRSFEGGHNYDQIPLYSVSGAFDEAALRRIITNAVRIDRDKLPYGRSETLGNHPLAEKVVFDAQARQITVTFPAVERLISLLKPASVANSKSQEGVWIVASLGIGLLITAVVGGGRRLSRREKSDTGT